MPRNDPALDHSLHTVRARILQGERPSPEEYRDLIRRITKRWPFEVDMDELFRTGQTIPPEVKL